MLQGELESLEQEDKLNQACLGKSLSQCKLRAKGWLLLAIRAVGGVGAREGQWGISVDKVPGRWLQTTSGIHSLALSALGSGCVGVSAWRRRPEARQL